MESQERKEKIEELRKWIAEHSEKKDVAPERLEAVELTCTLLEEEEKNEFLPDKEEEPDFDIFEGFGVADW